MSKEEFVEKVRAHYMDKDKEKAVSVFHEIRNYIRQLNLAVNLKANYSGLKFSGIGSFIEVKHRKLAFKLKENEIEIIQKENNENKLLDKIIVQSEVPTCKHGEFTVDEIDKYITECFNDLL